MMLTPEQRAELDSHSPSSIQFKLLQAGPGRGASVSGFKCGEITRGDIEDWLVDQNVLQRSRDRNLFFYSQWTFYITAATLIAAVIGVVATILHK
jgi:hypothetical protein